MNRPGLHDAEYEALTKRIRGWVEDWRAKLHLWGWDITIQYGDGVLPLKNSQGSRYEETEAAGAADVNWAYMRATLYFDVRKMISEENPEQVVLHEMLHVLVNEMRELSAYPNEVSHEERVVSHLTYAIAGLGKCGKDDLMWRIEQPEGLGDGAVRELD